MGLDMYLTKKFYVWSENRDKVKITGVKGVNSRKVKEICEDAGYWRKANAIHNWFVQNVQDGEDDCKDYYVSEDQMKDLLGLVKKVLKNHKLAEKLLPPASGFFFGDTNIDEWYFKDLEETQKILEEALADKGDAEYYYRSSW
jgi:hypothetical protein